MLTSSVPPPKRSAVGISLDIVDGYVQSVTVLTSSVPPPKRSAVGISLDIVRVQSF